MYVEMDARPDKAGKRPSPGGLLFYPYCIPSLRPMPDTQVLSIC